MNSEFTPDYSYACTVGEVCNKQSCIKSFGDRAYVTFNNRLCIWDVRTTDSTTLDVFKTETISSLCQYASPSLNIAVGSDKGMFKIYDEDLNVRNQVRLHTRPITRIEFYEGRLLIASSTSIYVYDTISEEIKARLDNEAWITDLTVFFGMLFVAAADGVIKVWDLTSLSQRSFVVLRESATRLAFVDGLLAIFSASGNIVFYDLDPNQHAKKLVMSGDQELGAAESDAIRDEMLCAMRHNIDNDVVVRRLCIKGTKDIKVTDTGIFVLSIKGMLVLQTAELKGGNRGVTEKTVIDKKSSFYKFDILGSEVVLLEHENAIRIFNMNKQTFRSIAYHESPIVDMEVAKSRGTDRIFTLSNESYIAWDIVGDKIEKRMSVHLEHRSFSLGVVHESLFVASVRGLRCFSVTTGEMAFEKDLGECKVVRAGSGILGVANNKTLRIYTLPKRKGTEKRLVVDDIVETRTEEYDDEICYVSFSPDNKLVGVSLYDTKVYVYNLQSFDVRFTLYGHSLPVVFLDFSLDSKKILTCGMDKLVKMWGLDFGECLKTFHETSKSVQFLSNDLFLCASDSIKYYKKHSLVKKFKVRDPVLIRARDDVLVCASFHTLILHKMDRYELVPGQDSDEEADDGLVVEAKVCNTGQFDQFSLLLERIENEKSHSGRDEIAKLHEEMYGLVEKIDFMELGRFLCLLNMSSISLIVEMMHGWTEKNTVVVCRLFMEIMRVHKGALKGNRSFFELYGKLMGRLRELRSTVDANLEE